MAKIGKRGLLENRENRENRRKLYKTLRTRDGLEQNRASARINTKIKELNTNTDKLSSGEIQQNKQKESKQRT